MPTFEPKPGFSGMRRLPGGDVIFESLGMLFVNELEREAFFEIPNDAREHPAERDLGLQRRSSFGRHGCA